MLLDSRPRVRCCPAHHVLFKETVAIVALPANPSPEGIEGIDFVGDGRVHVSI